MSRGWAVLAELAILPTEGLEGLLLAAILAIPFLEESLEANVGSWYGPSDNSIEGQVW